MAIKSKIADLFAAFETCTTQVSSRSVLDNSFRLDAGVYSPASMEACALVLRGGQEFSTVDDIAEVFGFGPFKRTYVESKKYSIPLLSSAEITEINPSPKFMCTVNLSDWEKYQVCRGWLLVSCSGTIGNVALVSQKWDHWGVSQDAVRVIPKPGYAGLIYSILRLPWGKDQLLRFKSGSVIDHIYPDDVRRIRIPLPESQVIDKADTLISQSLTRREESDGLINSANGLILHLCGLDCLTAEDAAWLDPERQVESMLVQASQVGRVNGDGSGFRLDAHFYNPTAQLTVANIKKCRSEVKTVGQVAERVFFCNRFTRTFVDKGHGIPYLAGKNIVQVRPTDLAYLSRSQTADLGQYRLEKGWILMTCSGTIGRTCLVWHNFEEYVATHDLIRVVPNQDALDGGYLYAFLSSDYGKAQVLRFKHGSVVDHVTPEQVRRVLIPCPSRKDQQAIGDKVRSAYEKRAEAIRLEDEAQALLMNELTKAQGAKGV